MSPRPRVLAIGGLDPSGGAGLTAYARMVQARGGLLLPVVVCLTVQNRRGVQLVEPIAGRSSAAALQAALDDGPVDAVVVGLLGDAGTARHAAALVAPLRARGVPVVVDPVLGATAGGWEGAAALVEAYRTCWAPLASVLCPNGAELQRLAAGAARELRALGADAVLVKGGDADGDVVEDLLHHAGGDAVFCHPRRDVGPVHGTGCALAAALAAGLGRGEPLERAVGAAIACVGRCLEATRRGADGAPVPLVIV